MNLNLQFDSIYTNQLNTDNFARMLKDPSQCYKFYWLEAILTLMETTEGDLSFDAIINEMICAAWYSVVNYHLHLGPTIRGKSENFLEHAIRILETDPVLPKPCTKQDLLQAIQRNNKELRNDKNGLAINVPYRLLSSFLNEIAGTSRLWYQRRQMIGYLLQANEKSPLPYIIVDGSGLEKKVRINPHWRQLIFDNYPVIRSWIQLKKVRFLQDRNPGVPGIIYKLEENEAGARKLNNARQLWKTVATVSDRPIRDIYTGRLLANHQFDLDHFIPWSYITNDELWNLTPMDGRLNSSKSNKLPEWDLYFASLAENQYFLYEMIFSREQVRGQFERCRRDNLNAIWATETLYVEGNSEGQFKNILEHNLKPLYESAKLQGYELWRFGGNVNCDVTFDERSEGFYLAAERNSSPKP